MSTQDQESFSRSYHRGYMRYKQMDLTQLQNIRCTLGQQAVMKRGIRNYDASFWGRYWASHDTYWQRFSKQLDFRGYSDPCAWPSRSPGTRIYGGSGQLIYADMAGEADEQAPEGSGTSQG